MNDNKILTRWSSERITKDNEWSMPPELILAEKENHGYKYTRLHPQKRLGSRYYTYTGFMAIGAELLEKRKNHPAKVYKIMGMDKLSGLGKLDPIKNIHDTNNLWQIFLGFRFKTYKTSENMI